jgi:tRNA dimethylallyltransferase
LALAERFQGEIVNCDSVAMYREFEIGTAKPTAAERARVPHHFFDCVDPTGFITAGEYARQARLVIAQVASRGRLPIVVGGTGLYLRALLEGLFAGPPRSEELRERLRERAERGPDYLHRLLRRLDRDAAEKIHANDTPKLIRAIEVCLASREKMTELWQQQGRDRLRGFRIVRIGLDPERTALYDRINRRGQGMFDAGLVEETQSLLQKYGGKAGPLAALGYKQAVQFLRGDLTRDQAIQATQQAHRRYAKRQMTWFRREPEVTWLAGFGDDPELQQQAVARVVGCGVRS